MAHIPGGSDRLMIPEDLLAEVADRVREAHSDEAGGSMTQRCTGPL